jgi:glycosyltransferase involved in cell wall biosynthesis
LRDQSRPYLAYKYFSNRYDTKVLYSEFSHRHKQYKEIKGEDFIPVKTFSYKRNISLVRILSHISFGLKIIKKIKKIDPDLIYVTVPPNISSFISSLYAEFKNKKLILDIVDIWPEALPFPKKIKKIQKYSYGIIWKELRNYAVRHSDYVLTESDYYINKLKLNNKKNCKRIYLSKIIKENNINEINSLKLVNKDEINIGYLGSISSIYDFESLVKLLKLLNASEKKVKLEIIGDGEKKEWLLEQLNKNNIKFNYHGLIFDENVKQQIFKNCDFGFNGFKDDTEVSLSYKSIDYLSYGLPLINSAKHDSWNLVNEHNIGINYDSKNINQLFENVISLNSSEINAMKKNAKDIFNQLFNWENYTKQMDQVMSEIR